MTEGTRQNDRTGGWRRLLPLCVFAVPAAIVLVMAAGPLSSAGEGEWLAQAVTSRIFVISAIIAFGSAVALAVILSMFVRLSAAMRQVRSGEDGAIIVEFALVLPFALFVTLLMVQASMLMGGNICVNYSAFCAARSAIVTVPLEFSDSEPWNVVDPDADSSGKMLRIKNAAVWAVLPVSCGYREYPAADAGDIVSGMEHLYSCYDKQLPERVSDGMGRKLAYARRYTEVELEPPADGEQYGESEDLRVKVKHTFYLAVPYAAWVFSKLEDGEKLDFAPGQYGLNMYAHCRLTNEGSQDFIETEEFPHALGE